MPADGAIRALLLQIARGWNAGDAGRLRAGADDRVGHRFGGERADDA